MLNDMFNTNLPITTNRTNHGTTAIIATLFDGSTALVGESKALGAKRAVYEVVRYRETPRIIERLEARDSAQQRAFWEAESAELERTANELGIALNA